MNEAMYVLSKLSKKCLQAENHPIMPMEAFPIHVNRKCPTGSRGMVFSGKPRLMAEFVSEEEIGWIGAIRCKDFRVWLEKNFTTDPESLVAMRSIIKPK